MSSILNFSIVKKPNSKKSQKSFKRLSNQHSKSYLSIYPTPTDQSKEARSIRSKEHKSKAKEEQVQSNRAIQKNIKYPIGIEGADRNALKEQPVITARILEKAIDQLFKFMKLILPNDIYSNIKAKFVEEINKSITLTINQDDSLSSVFSMIRTPWSFGSNEDNGEKNLKLSYDFLPSEKDNQNRNHNNQLNKKYNSNITYNQSKQSESGTNQSQLNTKMQNYYSQNKKRLFNDKKHSLYSLTKGKNINQTRSNSKSQSHSKEHSAILNKCGGTNSHLSLAKVNIINNIALNHKTINHSTTSKQFALGNAITTTSNKNSIKKGSITKTQNILNTKLFSQLQSDLLKMEITKCSNEKTQKNANSNSKKCSFEIANKKEISKNHSSDKLTKVNAMKQRTIDKAKLQSYRNETEKEKSKGKVINKNCSFKFNSNSNSTTTLNHQVKMKDAQEYKDNIKEEEEYIPKKNRKRDNIEQLDENNEIKNSEQLKEIKSSLDDNLKVMFNFSYECFLNRESESESKMSNENNNSQREENNKKNSYSYKKKYKY